MSLTLKAKHSINNYRIRDRVWKFPFSFASTIDDSLYLTSDMDVICTIIDDHTVKLHKKDTRSALSIEYNGQILTLSPQSSLVIDEETLKRSVINIVLSKNRHMTILNSTIICSCYDYGDNYSCSTICNDCTITNSFVLMFPECKEEHVEKLIKIDDSDGVIKINNESILFIVKDRLKFDLKIPKIHLSSTLIGLIIKDIWIYREGIGELLFKVKDENGNYKHFEVHGVSEYYSFSLVAFECVLFIGNGGYMRIKRHDEVHISETEYEQRFLDKPVSETDADATASVNADTNAKITDEDTNATDEATASATADATANATVEATTKTFTNVLANAIANVTALATANATANAKANTDINVKYIDDVFNRIKFLKQFPNAINNEQEFVKDIESDILIVKPNAIVFTDIDTLLDTVISVTIEENQTMQLFESIETLVPIECVYDYLSSALMYVVVGYTDCSRFIGFQYPFSFSEFYSSDVLEIINNIEFTGSL